MTTLEANQRMTAGANMKPTRPVPKGCAAKRMMTMAQDTPTMTFVCVSGSLTWMP
jgi:hypothetical protein